MLANHPALSKLWAKSDPYHPLWCHLLDTGAVCMSLLKCFGNVCEMPIKWIVFIVAMHDIGKADPEFQMHCDKGKCALEALGLPFTDNSNGFRHEARSGEFIYDYLRSNGWGKHAARIAQAAACGHHGNFHPELNCNKFDEWQNIRNELGAMIADIVGIRDEAFACVEFSNASVTGTQLVGLMVLSDWIASNDELFQFSQLDINTAPGDYYKYAQDKALRAIERLQLNKVDNIVADARGMSFRDIWPDIKHPNPSQSALETACLSGIAPGLAIIEVPMGEGKTESAVYLSEYWRTISGRCGTYIALPTMATSNQMHSRYEEFLTKQRPNGSAPRLVHGMAWLMDDIAPESDSETSGEDSTEEMALARDWFRPSKRALIAPEGVGTIDQALMAALNVKHGFLRLLGLSSKVLIIDEVHAYDEYMTTILERLLQWLRELRVPVIMLSATLSHRQKQRLINAYGSKLPECDDPSKLSYPLITFAPFDSEVQSVKVKSQPVRRIRLERHAGILDDAEATADIAAKLVENGGCACVLLNTVKQAQDVFKKLGESTFNGERYLFHARFPAWRRNEIEKNVVNLFGKDGFGAGKRPKKAILVATQVVEQSLDLDFDVMITQIAPIDLLLQRAGRLWRHKEIGIPRYGLDEAMHILLPEDNSNEFGVSKTIYGKSALLRTRAIVSDRKLFTLPDDFRPLIEACYGDGSVVGDIIAERNADMERDRKRQLDAGKAAMDLIDEPNSRDFALAQRTGKTLNESDDASQNFFSASTRLDRDTCSVLVLNDPLLINTADRSRPPSKDVLKALFLHKVNIPACWIKNAVNSDGSVAFPECPKWLRRAKVIPMTDGVWQGMRDSKMIRITYDDFMGLKMEEPE